TSVWTASSRSRVRSPRPRSSPSGKRRSRNHCDRSILEERRPGVAPLLVRGSWLAVDVIIEILKAVLTLAFVGFVLVAIATLFIVVFQFAADLDDRLTRR